MNLAEITKLTEDQARAYLEGLLWPDGPICPHCKHRGADRIIGKAARAGLLRCHDCRKQFTVTVGTIFERSHIPLRKWIMAFQMMCASKKGVSALQLQRQLGLKGYKSAWHMAHRIRYAMTAEPLSSMLKSKLKGRVEVDETYIGGKTREGICGRGSERKTPVVALVERKGRMRTRVVEHVGAKQLKSAIRQMVDRKATIYTDEWFGYRGIGKEFRGGHETVSHSRGEYSRGDVHVNSAESYFALLKRGIHGAFHHVSKKHLHRYCNEFSFRWNHRDVDDGRCMQAALQAIAGKRLTYSSSSSHSS